MLNNMANATTDLPLPVKELPALPSYTLDLRPSLIPGVSDVVLQLVAPVVAYWVVSLFFLILDTYDLFPQYRLHTPAEISKRNHVSRYEVFRDVVVQQVLQTVFGLAMAYFDPPEMIGREQYSIAVWAQRLRRVQHELPTGLGVLGVDSLKLALNLSDSAPNLAGALAGGIYPTQGFAAWEINAAKFIYWVGVPAIQFTVAIVWVDTWQYFLHRAMHMNKFLYTWLHSRHHRLYVPYAYGALYNHPIEGFMLDTLGTGLAYLATGMTVQQGMWFFTCSTIKTVDDHCGYAFPWDPLQHATSNNAAYHDVHHQSWGIKSNFSQPFFTFWDRYLNTTWKGGDVSSRYQRDRIAAQRKVDADAAPLRTVTNSSEIDDEKARVQAKESQQQVLESDGPHIIAEERREEQEVKQSVRRTPRRKSGFDPRSLSDRVAGSLQTECIR